MNNKEYEIVCNVPIAQANEAVYNFLNKSESNVISKNKIDEIPAGCRNDTLFKIACSLHSRGVSDEGILACLLKENEVRCNPSLSSDEVKGIEDSAISRYPKGKMQVFSSKESESITADDLLKMKLSSIPNVIDNLIAVGVKLFGAAPKSGKTFFSLQMANCVASGLPFLGHDVRQGTVYYLALENVKQNIQKRLRNFKIDISSNLIIHFGRAYDKTFDLERVIIDLKKITSRFKDGRC